MISRVVDHALHTVSDRGDDVRPEVATFQERIPVVDLLVGTPLFRRTFVEPIGHGHVDLSRLEAGGVDLVGLSLATRFPNRGGTLSTPHFWSLGVPPRALHRGMSIIRTLVARIERWEAASGGRLRLVRTTADLDAVLVPGGPVGAFLGVQGGQSLDGRLDNLDRLHRLGVRMFALAHVMDTDLAGSGSGRRAGGITPTGGDAIARMERLGIVVDLAHASSAAISDAVPLLGRPFVLSHTGFVERCGTTSRWRRYSPATRNVAASDARLVADAGGVVGVTTSTQLLGGSRLPDLVNTIRWAADLLGPDHVAIGSDMDGALRSVIDAAGMPRVTAGLLDAGMPEGDVAAIMGGNAVRVLRAALDVPLGPRPRS